MEKREIRDLALSAIALALAFAIADAGGFSGIRGLSLALVFIALVTVSVSFILHEMGHRYVARRFDCYAEYVMWTNGIAFALITSLFGIVFAAPGAVYIHPKQDLWGTSVHVSKKKYGIIALAGPVINLALAGIFFLLATVYGQLFLTGVTINIWLAFFNSFPIPPLDGHKIFSWDKRIWVGFFAACFVLSWYMIAF